MCQLRTDKLQAEAELRAAKPPVVVTAAEIRTTIEDLGDIAAVLADADRKQKAQLYDELGLELVFDPELNRVLVEASVPCTRSVSEDRRVQSPTYIGGGASQAQFSGAQSRRYGILRLEAVGLAAGRRVYPYGQVIVPSTTIVLPVPPMSSRMAVEVNVTVLPLA
jgi:hypothetical protein